MKQLRKAYLIKASRAAVWDALTNPVTIKRWGGGPAVMDAELGTKFTLWGGDIFGKNTAVVPMKLLVQEWSDGTFATPSEVRFELTGVGNETSLELVHESIPDGRFKEIDEGWQEYYLGPLKALLEDGRTSSGL